MTVPVALRASTLAALAVLALAAIIAAWLSGARFVGTTSNDASLAMAIATGIAILAYILILFLDATQQPARKPVVREQPESCALGARGRGACA